MDVRIRETGEIKGLNIVDANGISWVTDLIGNAGALTDGQFVHDDSPDNEYGYVADQETYDWWKNYIDGQNRTNDDIDELASQLEDAGYDEDDYDMPPESYIRSRLQDDTRNWSDYEDHRYIQVDILNEIRKEFNLPEVN